MRCNQDLRPEKRRSIFENSAVDTVEQFLVLVLNCLSSDVALGSRPRECTTLDDNDMCGRGDPLVDKVTGAEFTRSPYDLLLELLWVHGTLLRSLDEQGRRRSVVANHNALEDEFATGSTDIVLKRPESANHERLRIMRSRSCVLTWYHTFRSQP